MVKYNLDMILSNKKVPYNKADLSYQLDNNAKKFMSICHAKKKNICIIYKCNYCHIYGHFEPYCFRKKWGLK